MTLPSAENNHDGMDNNSVCEELAEQEATGTMRFGPRGDTGYLPIEFVMMTLPYQRPKDTYWERVNGLDRLTIQAGRFTDAQGEVHQFVPYGKQARAALLYIMTQVRLSRSRDIEIGKSFHQFAIAAGIPVSGQNQKAAVHQLRALLRCTVSYSKVVTENDKMHVAEGQYVVSDKADLWLDVRKESIGEDGLLTSTIRISESLFESVMSNQTRPLDLAKYSRLASGNSPMAMDIYVWLVARIFTLDQGKGIRAFIKWEDLHSQFGSTDNIRSFKQSFQTALDKVLAIDETLRVQVWKGTTQRKGFKGLVVYRTPGTVGTKGPDNALPQGSGPGDGPSWEQGSAPI